MEKQELYNSIMRNVSREIKRVLNEAEETKDPVVKAADKLCAELKKNHKSLQTAIDFMTIITVSKTDVDDYSDPEFKKNKYEGVTYAKLIPELKKRLK